MNNRGERVHVSLAVETKSLVKQFGNIRALDDLSFSVKPGEVYGLIGPNGAGKTTTLRTICTLILPTSGSVNIFGLDVAKKLMKSVKSLATCPRNQEHTLTLQVTNTLSSWQNSIKKKTQT